MTEAVPSGRSDDRGSDMLADISNEIVRAQKKFFGKGPEQAKSYILDDLLIVVMRGGLTTAEQTMLEFGQPDMVRRFRQLFEDAMTERLTSIIEDLTGRKVVNYQSQVMFDPDLVVEMFVFEDRAAEDAIEATAHGQIRHDDAGAATDGRALDDGSESGR